MDRAVSFQDAENRQIPRRVPMLDWPSDLFGGNAGLGELMTEDWTSRCDASFPSHGETGAELHLWAA